MTDPFSTEIPALLTKHLDHLNSSAISLEVIRERGYESVLGKAALKTAGFSKSQQRHPGILIPLHGVDGSVVGYQYRPDNSRRDARRDRPIKYENPTGSSVRLDVPPRCRGQLGDPSVPLWVTEGVKKVDALASRGACAICLTGVWGFKGKNPLGGTTILADFDYIAFKDRLVYCVFDSDSTSNPQVRQALTRLNEHLRRKGAKIRTTKIPPGSGGEKVGVDDYLAQGHTLDDIIGLEAFEDDIPLTLRERTNEMYCIEDGRLCWVKRSSDGQIVTPLCNFTARITEIITRDNGLDISKAFNIIGAEGSGGPLPEVEVPATGLESMSWVTAEWDTRAIISATQTAKGRLREAILLHSQDAARRTIYSHSGWRDFEGQMAFLTASGALGMPEVDVEIEEDLKNYALPALVDDPTEALKASYDFLQIGNIDVLLPLWAAMYLSPLSEILEPAFTLFLTGPSGSFKSTVTALALNHFGQKFDEYHLPAAWRDTENKLEKLLFLAKDLPLVIDDWAPGQDSAKARELEVKAEHVIRAQGNRQGKGRLRSDTSSRKTYIPRGLLITSGEHLPSGHSHTARVFSVELGTDDFDLVKLTAAQSQKHLYSVAMSHYILWLGKNWERVRGLLRTQYNVWRDQARVEDQHPRMPGVVAWLYAGLGSALDFLSEQGAIDGNEAQAMAKRGWEVFVNLSAEQSWRIEEQRPGKLFMESLKTLIDQGKAVFWSKDDDAPRAPTPGRVAVGWTDREGNIYLNPTAAYSAVRDFCQHTDVPFTIKQHAVWKDLRSLNLTECQNGRNQIPIRVYGQLKRVVKLKARLTQADTIEEEDPEK